MTIQRSHTNRIYNLTYHLSSVDLEEIVKSLAAYSHIIYFFDKCDGSCAVEDQPELDRGDY